MAEYEVLYDKILVERMPEEDMKAGLEIPSKYREKQSMGTVRSVGQGRVSADGTLSPLTIKVGDIVLFNQFSGVELPEEGKGLLILREDEVLARVRQDSPQLQAV